MQGEATPILVVRHKVVQESDSSLLPGCPFSITKGSGDKNSGNYPEGIKGPQVFKGINSSSAQLNSHYAYELAI